MPPPPADAKIYHILHIDRLPSVVASGGLFSDSRMRREQCGGTTIGMGELKATRLYKAVDVKPGTYVGDYVPFYFCSRSVMLYVIHMANHAALQYRGGQRPIVHLEVSLRGALDWADANNVQWAVSLGNATATYTEFRADRAGVSDIRWDLIPNSDFRDPQVKDAKQSEALFFDFFPWELVERVGAIDAATAHQAAQIMQDNPHRPVAQAMRGWYY
jgi:hypothetical protein